VYRIHWVRNVFIPKKAKKVDSPPVTPISAKQSKEDAGDTLADCLLALGPTTPLSVRFGDIPNSAKKSPFAVPNLNAAPKKEPSFTTRPTAIGDFGRVGLEPALAKFSLNDPQTEDKKEGAMDQLVLTAALILARVATQQQNLTALLLVGSVGLRGFVWRRIPETVKIALNCLVLLRLLLHNTFLGVPQLMLDLVLILSR